MGAVGMGTHTVQPHWMESCHCQGRELESRRCKAEDSPAIVLLECSQEGVGVKDRTPEAEKTADMKTSRQAPSPTAALRSVQSPLARAPDRARQYRRDPT